MKERPFYKSNNKDSALFCKPCAKSISEPPSTVATQAPAKTGSKPGRLKTSLMVSGVSLLILITLMLPSA